ncbi:MAG: MGMT family protein [Clostridia bacterium]|nr:MGMT family protein [Clostridia bacterium]
MSRFDFEPKGSSTFDQIYAEVKMIPAGKVASYGYIACRLGNLRLSRVVGYALHSNPDPENIPCHRIVMKNGALAPGFVFGGPCEQRKRLEAEGVSFLPDGRVDMEKCGMRL